MLENNKPRENWTGRRVRINFQRFADRQKSKRFAAFLEASRGRTFTAVLDIDNKLVQMYALKEDESEPKWLFFPEDLILAEEDGGTQLKEKLSEVFARVPYKAVVSKPARKDAPYRKIDLERKESAYLVSQYTEKQVFHKNLSPREAESFCGEVLGTDFLQLNAWDEGGESMLLISKKGKVAAKRKDRPAGAPLPQESHNRQKQYLIPEGTVVPPLVDMGIFTAEGKVVRTMYDKFRQINRFVELIDDTVEDLKPEHLNIIDFGCGKSYLTFVLYYYFTEIKKIPVRIIGLDLKADVIQKCNAAARKYGYDSLSFELGDINGYQSPFRPDMVITLHACDTATDFALYNAVQWGARMIFSVPCCQHELNGQMEPAHLSILSRYGILKERFAALSTDAVRGNLLEACGYKTQLLEFIDLSHTPKNVLIRAVKSNIPASSRKKALAEVRALAEEFRFRPTLYNLLNNARKLPADDASDA